MKQDLSIFWAFVGIALGLIAIQSINHAEKDARKKLFVPQQISKKTHGFVYSYPISVSSVYDGDTMTADIDLGLEIKISSQKIRLLGCDAYELNVKEENRGIKAKTVSEKFVEQGNLRLFTFGERDSFGRILGDVVDERGTNLKDILSSSSLITSRFLNSPQPHQTLIDQYHKQ